MKFKSTLSGLMLLVFAAVAGLAFIYLPNWIISNYRVAVSLGQFWGISYLVLVGLGVALLAGSAGWTIWTLWGASLAKRRQSEQRNKNPSQLTSNQQQAEIAANLDQIQNLKEVAETPEINDRLQDLIRDFEAKRVAETLEIVAFGTISSGKSSLLNLLSGRDTFATDVVGGTTVRRHEIPWPGFDRVLLVDTPGLGEVDGADHVSLAASSAKDADLVLLVVDGPLRQSEFKLVQQLGAMEKRIIICLNKSDWYSESDRNKLIGQISRQTQDFVDVEDIISVQAQAGQRLRKKILVDGSEIEEAVVINPAIEALAQRMLSVVKSEGKRLIIANLLLQSRGMVEKARLEVRESLNKKALRIVDNYMWGAGGAAALSPFPIVDLIAGSAISTKMILDLADVYQQKIDFQTAAKWLNEMGKNLIGMLGAQGASVAVTAITASLLKTIPVAGQLAGGMLQGATQALITKWIGAVFIDYFQNDMQTPSGGLAGLARRHWEEVTSVDELRKLLTQAREKLNQRSQ